MITNNNISELTQRVVQVMKSKNLSQNEFATKIGLTGGYMSEVITGKKDPGIRVITGILSAFANISTEWLMRGTGEMYLIKQDYKPESPIRQKDANFLDLERRIAALETENAILKGKIEVYQEVMALRSEKPPEKYAAGGSEYSQTGT